MTPDPVRTADESALVDLLARAIDLRERGTQVDPATLCADRQDLVERLRDALAAHDRLGSAIEDCDTRVGASDPMLGRVLGDRYEIARRVGMGAMGSVFAARDHTLQRYVALKIVEPWVLDDDERRARFRREAQAIAALRHASIVAVHDHGDGDLPFLAMELVPGLDLEAVLDRRIDGAGGARGRGEAILAAFERTARREAAAQPALFGASELVPDARAWLQPWPVLAARIALAIARALAHAHGHGVLHRDVKPSNVRLKPDGGVVLLDFGLARVPGTGSLTREGTLLGTLAYMAPEQVRGERVSASADVYGLGATLYRLLTLRPPFLGEPAALMKQILDDDAPAVRRLAPEVPRDLAAICQHAIEKRPQDRYASATAMAADLEAFLEYRPVVAAPPSIAGRTWRRLRRYPARAAAVGLIGVALPLAVMAKQGRDARAAERMRADAHAARAAVPALVTLEGRNPAMSVAAWRLPSPDPQGLALDRLSRVLQVDADDDEALCLRAMLHLDCGRAVEGRADLRRLLSRHTDSVVLAAVCARLGAGATSLPEAWREQVVDGLPAPRSAFDAFLAGYLKMRAVRYRDAVADLEAALARQREYLPALHLLPLALLGVGRYAEAHEAALGVEGAIGRPTARTRHVIGRERLERGRIPEAIAAFTTSLELCPYQHGPLQNLGTCWLQLGEPDKAGQAFASALAIRPDAVPTLRSKIQVLGLLQQTVELAEFEARVAADVGRPWWLQLELGEIAVRAARRAACAGTDDERLRLCRDAITLFTDALATMPEGSAERAKAQTRLAIASRLAEGDAAAVADQYLLGMTFGAKEPATVRDAAALYAATGKPAIALYLLAQAQASAPRDPGLGQDLIEILVQRGDVESLLRAAQVWQTCFRDNQIPLADQLRQRILAAAADQDRDVLARCRDALGSDPPPSTVTTPPPSAAAAAASPARSR